jgi:predicted RNase H-like HicB family nuclease
MNSEHYSMSIQWSEPDQAYIVTVPELPGCRTHGETYQEAVTMGLEAIAGWLEAAKEAGWTIPPPRIIAA